MPADRKVQERRREAILEILTSDEPVGQQRELVHLLRERGIPATQSSVSRDLAEIGAIRLGDKWILPDWVGVVSPFEKVADFVVEVRPAGPYQSLMITKPGAGPVVAKAIDDSGWDYVVGTLAGLNSVLILTDGGFDQKLLFARLKSHLGHDDDGAGEGKG